MRINDILKKKKTFSFEVFPPNPENSNIQDIYNTLDALQQFRPDFISVTFKSSGDFSQNTIDLACYIQHHIAAEPLVHLTCGALDERDVDALAAKLQAEGLENVLALRGDKPAHFEGDYLKHFKHSTELMEHLRRQYDFCLAGACYPEGHIESESIRDDIATLKLKQDMGAQFLITQLFYDNNYYYRLVRVARQMGITIPIIPGIMPLTSAVMFNKINTLLEAAMMAMGSAVTTFVGQNAGAKQIDRAYKGNRIGSLVAVVICIVLPSLLFIFADPLMSIFGKDMEMKAVAVHMLRGVTLTRFVMIPLTTFGGTLRAMKRSMPVTIATLAGLIGMRQLYLFIISKVMYTPLAVAYCLPVGWGFGSLFVMIPYFYYRKKDMDAVRAQKDAQYYIDNCDRIVENNGDPAAFIREFKKALEDA